MSVDGVRFDRPVPLGGYAWWYVDAVSDDGRAGLTLIAFVGSAFSTWYAGARGLKRGLADPEDFVCFHASLYLPDGTRGPSWAMLERGREALKRERGSIGIGRSGMVWDGATLTASVDEPAWPFGRGRVQGEVRVEPEAVTDQDFALDPEGRHRWWPIAPRGRATVRFANPELAFEGRAYFDTNRGVRPMERDFASWDWSRADLKRGSAVLYNRSLRPSGGGFEVEGGGERALALKIAPDGRIERIEPPPPAELPPTRWRLARRTRADAGSSPRVVRALEDAPFYARGVVAQRLFGEEVEAVHEDISLDRLRHPLVRFMLPWKNPREMAPFPKS